MSYVCSPFVVSFEDRKGYTHSKERNRLSTEHDLPKPREYILWRDGVGYNWRTLVLVPDAGSL